MTGAASSGVVLAEVERSGFVESRHHGSVIGLRADGTAELVLGDPDAPVFPRSSSKPLQAVGMLRAGLDVDGELLALVAASHNGEDFHLDGVRRILAAAGLDEAALQNPPGLPLGEAARLAWLRAQRPPAPLAMNCSGKHAGMLATCVAAGWPISTYRDPGSPLQRGLRSTVEQLTGEQVEATGVDGCGAPLFALSLRGVARAFASIATAEAGTPEGRVARAIRRHPAYVGGTGRDVTRLLEGVPGLVAKDGAEAVYAAALPDGRAVAVKIEDGGERARVPVLVAVLRRLGVDAPVLAELETVPVYGGGLPVGAVRAVC